MCPRNDHNMKWTCYVNFGDNGDMEQHQKAEKPLRKDAAQRRQLLIDVAREVFAEHGVKATLHDVAREAGVGVGTVYRRFANKQELLEEIYKEQVDELEQLLHEALALEDAWEALEFYVRRSIALQVRDRGMAQIISGHYMTKDLFDASRARIAPLVNALAKNAVRSGQARADLVGTDLIFVQIGLLAIADMQYLDAAQGMEAMVGKLYERYLQIALDGMRVEAAREALPVPPLTTDETHRLFS